MIFFFRVRVGYFFLITGDPVLIRGPFAQVHELAPLRAERPEFISVPGRFFFTYRAGDFVDFHIFVRDPVVCLPQLLQNI